INFVTTILKIRAPGMSYLRMTIFCWTALAANLLIVAAFPVLTATLGMLALDRYLRSEEHTSELQSLTNLVCRLLLEKKSNNIPPLPHYGGPRTTISCVPRTLRSAPRVGHSRFSAPYAGGGPSVQMTPEVLAPYLTST